MEPIRNGAGRFPASGNGNSMRLFDLLPQEKKGLKVFLIWHFGYALYVCLFFFVIYEYNLFKSYWFLEEFWLLNLVAPLHTVVFILCGPYRQEWLRALKSMYKALDGDTIFCIMALIVFLVGFYLYTLIIWLLGVLVPSIIFN